MLFEITDEFGRILPLLGTTTLGGLLWEDQVTEFPRLGTTEIWEIYNTTGDSHPIHIHELVFQIIDRQLFTADQDPVTCALNNITFTSLPIPPAANEQGWKDTFVAPPSTNEESFGQVTRVIMKFQHPEPYVWHCHIISHEDHDMMRPYIITQ